MRKLSFVLLAIFVIFLSACSKEGLTGTDNETKENERSGEKSGIEAPGNKKENETIFPLTGIGTDEEVDNRIISVMMNNHPAARPQSGLSQADVVYEILAEGMITRLLALYQSEMPDIVGPVRSAREYYFELANGYDSIYVYHGAAGFINDMIKNRGINYLDGAIYDNDGNLFKRETFRKAPHNSYLLLDAVYDIAGGKGYETAISYEPMEFLTEEGIDNLSGDTAEYVKIIYSNSPSWVVEYTYDKAGGNYFRSSDGERTVELNTEAPVKVENIFIVETYHEVIDDAGRRAIDLESGGNGYLIQKGHMQEVQWENRDGRIVPVKDGQLAGFVPGKTWINVVPTNPGMQQSVTFSN
ncbi:DUF3048 domain-containing protein [Oceanobacillus saliphilus]|uniref:DUF3048 domain-containing protein n=1 Tax=Oceanobacillus saliphilus TaxID=2925834 RepID=UPI00201E133B|nr:DUF3048 domain-containing protein [Oceanobacillus saliphilus]